MKVLLLENIHSSAHELLEENGFEVESLTGALSEDELCEKVREVQVLGIRSKTQVTPRVIAAAPNLLTLGCFCIGTNQVDLRAAKLSGVPVFNAPFSNTRSVAEMILAEVVMLARQLGDRLKEVHAGRWRKVSAGCFEVRGKTLGIVGYGHIGSQIGVLAESFGMRVVFYDIATKLPMGNNRPCGTLQELLSVSDFVTLHVPATPQTHRMMGPEEIARMKRGAYLLNASRGTVVQIPALAAALKGGRLAGAAVDVFPEEPETNSDGFESELRGLSNVILTPHIGGSPPPPTPPPPPPPPPPPHPPPRPPPPTRPPPPPRRGRQPPARPPAADPPGDPPAARGGRTGPASFPRPPPSPPALPSPPRFCYTPPLALTDVSVTPSGGPRSCSIPARLRLFSAWMSVPRR